MSIPIFLYLCSMAQMKKTKNNPIPQYLMDQVNSLLPKKGTYTSEDIERLNREIAQVNKQMEQLEDAKKYDAISKEEAGITKIMLLAMKLIQQEVTEDIQRYLKDLKDKLAKLEKEQEGN